ncbi:MAG: hypothetical protein R3223_01355 [Longimicrobiales bacterium]|nr:hypothetical protein [Longimicrobiales bacterium]
MSLLQFHRLLIAFGILFCLGYAGWEVRGLLEDGSFSSLALAMVFGLLAFILSVYLWQLNRWLGYGEEDRRHPSEEGKGR